MLLLSRYSDDTVKYEIFVIFESNMILFRLQHMIQIFYYCLATHENLEFYYFTNSQTHSIRNKSLLYRPSLNSNLFQHPESGSHVPADTRVFPQQGLSECNTLVTRLHEGAEQPFKKGFYF